MGTKSRYNADDGPVQREMFVFHRWLFRIHRNVNFKLVIGLLKSIVGDRTVRNSTKGHDWYVRKRIDFTMVL